YSVTDIDFSSVCESHYDLGLFASGYEKRCTHIARSIRLSNIKELLVLGFAEVDDNTQRRENDAYFRAGRKFSYATSSGNDDSIVYKYLCAASVPESVTVLIDYSSMSKIWCAAILNWARYSEAEEIKI